MVSDQGLHVNANISLYLHLLLQLKKGGAPPESRLWASCSVIIGARGDDLRSERLINNIISPLFGKFWG